MRGKVLSVALSAVLVSSGALFGCSSDQDAQTSAQQGQASSQDATVGEYTFTDDLGREVTVPKNPQRVVACMGSFADVWQLSGGTLVGAAEESFADYEIDSQSVVSVGGFSSLDFEKVLSCNPDFVIMTASTAGKDGAASQVDYAETLEASGIPVAYFDVSDFDDYLRMLGVCCEITGRSDLYEKNGLEVQRRIEEAVADYAVSGEAPSYLLMITYGQGVRAQASSTLAGTVISDLGLRNVVDDDKSLLADFSLESVIGLNPDYIFCISMGEDEESAKRALEAATVGNPAWAELEAVKNGRLVMLDKSLFLNKPNDRWAESYRVVGEALGGVS